MIFEESIGVFTRKDSTKKSRRCSKGTKHTRPNPSAPKELNYSTSDVIEIGNKNLETSITQKSTVQGANDIR